MQIREQFVRRLGAVEHIALEVDQLVMDEQSFVRAVVEEFIERELDLARGDPEAQVVAGDRFERVGLVEDDGVVVGQNRRVDAAQRQIAEKERVVNDQDLRVARAGARESKNSPCRSGSCDPGNSRSRSPPLPRPLPSGRKLRSLSEPSPVSCAQSRICRS